MSMNLTPQDGRPRYQVTAPDSVRLFPHDPKVFVFVPLTAQQEIDAVNVAEATKGSPAIEFVRRAIESVDGKPVDWATGGDRWLDACSPKLREALMNQYRRLFQPSEAENAAFFGSLEVLA